MIARFLPLALFCAVLLHLTAPDVRGDNVLLVTNNNGYLTSQESLRKSRFESWGHTVNTIWDAASQATFDAAFDANDVVYVCEEANANDVSYKLRNAPIGVISEERYLDVELGFSSRDGTGTSQRNIRITDNSHDITSSFSTGSLRIVSGWEPLIYMSGAAAPDGQTLATIGGDPALFVVEAGGALANTYDGNATAAGRRVRLPFGDTDFNFSRLRTNGRTLLENALSWAAERSSVTGLVGHWALNDTSGTTAVDTSDNHNDGTYTGGFTLNSPGPYPGAGSVAASFDGSTGYVAVPSESDYDLTGAISIAVWIKVDAFDATWQAIICKGDSAWRLSRNANTNTLHFALTGVNPLSLNGNVDVNDGQWHHVVCTYDGSTKRLYVDGQLDVSASVTGSIATNDYAVLIGANGQAGNREWSGSLFDVRVYDYALTQQEVAELYGLVGHWKLDETAGTTAADSSGGGNDGTVDGSAAWTDGKVDGALQLNGATLVDVPNLFGSPPSASIAAWANLTNPDSSGSEVFSIGDYLAMRLDNTHTSSYAFFYNGSSWTTLSINRTFDDSGWHHFTIVYCDPDDTFKIYVDGEETASLSTTQPIVYTGLGDSLAIGAHGNQQTSYDFTGMIDDVRVYNRPLSPTEIQQLYGSGTPAGVRIIRWVEVQ